jgi:hypothetical protein
MAYVFTILIKLVLVAAISFILEDMRSGYQWTKKRVLQ